MNRLREVRKENNLRLKDVADFLGVTVATINMYENGNRDMSTSTLIALSKFFNTSVDYLLGISSVPFLNLDVKNSRLKCMRETIDRFSFDIQLFAHRLLLERKESKLTQENLAFVLGLNNKSSISQYEKRTDNP